MPNILAIVGRPNVGKSTLFNRILGRRVAITLKAPGVTRDRLSAPASWRGRHFVLFDTGGLTARGDDPVRREVDRQVAIAVEQAAVVIFLVDARDGLTAMDEEIAGQLRRQGKNVLLAVNKTDTREGGANRSEFHALGYQQVFALSAERGDGVAELLDAAVAMLPEAAPPGTGHLRLVILGRPNVGKSTFFNALLGEYRAIVDDRPGTTRDSVEQVFTAGGEQFTVVDTAGLRRAARVAEAVEYYSTVRALRGLDAADVALLMLDAGEGLARQDKRIAALIHDRGKGLVIVLNKSDLLDTAARRNLAERVREELGFAGQPPIVPAQARLGQGIERVLAAARQVYAEGGKTVSQRILLETVLPALRARALPGGLRVRRIVQRGVRPPQFVCYVRGAGTPTETARRYVVNLLRRTFGFTGNPVRVHFESTT